jgi:hypothetical protein
MVVVALCSLFRSMAGRAVKTISEGISLGRARFAPSRECRLVRLGGSLALPLMRLLMRLGGSLALPPAEIGPYRLGFENSLRGSVTTA